MQSISGVVTIVQEGRFQLLDDNGVAHLFVLHYGAAPDPQQLPRTLNRRVRVSYTDSNDVIGHSARRLMLEDA